MVGIQVFHKMMQELSHHQLCRYLQIDESPNWWEGKIKLYIVYIYTLIKQKSFEAFILLNRRHSKRKLKNTRIYSTWSPKANTVQRYHIWYRENKWKTQWRFTILGFHLFIFIRLFSSFGKAQLCFLCKYRGSASI